ncbi:MAG TPA: glycosyltransferase family 4 protein [Atopostipes sp.]|nr:glycosyltransferase family 4 protein [Atopostipes sp.]
MRVYLCSDHYEQIKKSGVGRALEHQKMALDAADVAYTFSFDAPYEVIHINTIFPLSYLKAKKAKKQGKAVVYHAHSTKEDFRNSYLFANAAASLFGWWIKKCYQTADLILTPSTYSKCLLENYGLEKPIEVISNGIDLDYWQASAEEVRAFREKYGIQPDDKMIMSVGLPIKRKGILDFVEMAKRLPEYHFIWFGYSDPKFLPKDVVAALKTELPNLQFPGYIDREDLRVAYQACDLYVFLTHEETEGIVLLEALASHADTLVRDIPVFSDYVHGENIYKGSDLDAFIAIAEGLLKEEFPSLVDAGYQKVSEKSIERVGEQLKEHYLRVLEKGPLNARFFRS